MIADMLAFANIMLALTVAYYGWRFVLANNIPHAWRWLKVAQVFVGLYWAGLYAYVLFWPYPTDPVLFGQMFVRPGFTVTLAIMAASAIQRYRAK